MKFFFALICVSTLAHAQYGADALLQTTGTSVENKTGTQNLDMGQFKLSDPFLQTVFLEWRSAGNLPFEVNRWFTQVLNHDYANAAHQWTAVQNHLPASLKPVANYTWAYLAWRMELSNTFVDAWTEARRSGANERVSLSFAQTLAMENPAQWVNNNRPFIGATLATELLAMPAPVGLELELTALAGQHNPQHAARILEQLPLGHPLALDLATTAVLNHARKGEVGEAGKILKRRVEPELEKRGNARALPQHYLTLGRLLFQAGALEAAEAFYARVPRGVPEFIPARTERTWALLRLNRIGELRGELQSLASVTLKDRFLPEVSLVRSISNLKLCRYGDVAQDFKMFVETQGTWARTIQAALVDPTKAKLDMPDRRVQMTEAAIALRQKEEASLNKLAEASINATLPAVGVQPHWKAAQNRLAEVTSEQQSQLTKEKTRFWKNREVVLTEAIRKMKFVKVEAMSQMRMANASAPTTEAASDTVARIQAAPKKGAQTYLFDGVYWPDEQFNLHAKAQTRCGGQP